ncbi:MAG: hypothetical protein MSJ26_08890 [Oscillospiraceae bacterium]|nr:hypothetical protein [Oscillospiraceae bacterium]
MRLSFYPSGTAEDIAICLGVTYLSACLGRDDHLPSEAAGMIRCGAMLLCMLCWLVMAFISGLRMRRRFAAGMCICLVLPAALQPLMGIRAVKFSAWGIAADKLCRIISRLPFAELERASGINGNVFSVLTAAMGLLLFGAGYFYTKKLLSNFERNDTL